METGLKSFFIARSFRNTRLAHNLRQPSKTGGKQFTVWCLGFVLGLFMLMTIKTETAYADTANIQNFTDLGTMGGRNSDAHGISANGSVIVGSFTDANNNDHAFRWTQSGGVQDLGAIGGNNPNKTFINGISADGSVIVGSILDANKNGHAFRWTQSGGVQDLGAMGGKIAFATGVTADGSVIVGYILDTNYKGHAYRWTQSGGIQDLGPMIGNIATANGVSADGSVIVGSFTDANNTVHAYRWTQSGGIQDLGTMGGKGASANGVSADGSVIVGSIFDANNNTRHAFRWTQKGGIQELGNMGGQSADAYGVSADGLVIVGTFFDGNWKKRAFLLRLENTIVKGTTSSASGSSAAISEPLSPEEQARYEKVLTTGRPAQIYALAVNMGLQNRNDLAAKLYQVLIDKFPDDAYTAKAIDKMEATQKAAQQQVINQQQQAGQVQMQRQQLSAMQQATQKRIANCRARCDLAASSCQEQVNRQNSQAVANAVIGAMSRNSSAAMNGMNSYNDTNACDNNLQSCYLSCQ